MYATSHADTRNMIINNNDIIDNHRSKLDITAHVLCVRNHIVEDMTEDKGPVNRGGQEVK